MNNDSNHNSNHDGDIDARIRAAMHDEAESFGETSGFANRVIQLSRIEDTPGGARRWLFPVAAAAVAAVLVAAVPLGIHLARSSRTTATGPDGSTPVASSVPAASTPVTSPAPAQTTATTASVPTTSAPASVAVPAGFRVEDLTWISNDQGFALGAKGLVTTTDGGAHWALVNDSLPSGTSHIRFANSSVGYLFGPRLYLTTDGGRTWSAQPGGEVSALEIAGSRVARLESDHSGCPGPCNVKLFVADIGSATWTQSALPQASGFGNELARHGSTLAVLALGHPAGGAGSATSTLYVSTDDGSTWVSRGEPCPQNATGSNREVDSSSLTIAADGSMSVLCVPRGGTGGTSVSTSTDDGRTWQTSSPSLGTGGALAAATSTTMLVMTDVLYRTTDGGNHWRRVQENSSPAPLTATWIGWESTTTGRVVEKHASDDGTTVWTTRDGGATWTAFTFS